MAHILFCEKSVCVLLVLEGMTGGVLGIRTPQMTTLLLGPQEIDGTEIVYTRVAAPKAVLLLFHGCSHSALDWGRSSATCPGCLGDCPYPHSEPQAQPTHFAMLHVSPIPIPFQRGAHIEPC